jgi:hypothetical protein
MFCNKEQNVDADRLALMTRSQEVPGSNIDPVSVFRRHFLLFSVTPGKYRNCTL